MPNRHLRQDKKSRSNLLTGDCTTSSTASHVIHDGGITLDGAIDGQIAAVTTVGDLVVLKHFDGRFNSLNGRRSCLEELHGYAASPD